MLNNKILNALNHIRKSYPEVTHAVFFSYDVWNYYTDEMFAPAFDRTKVNYDVLDAAAESLEVEHFPFIYKVGPSGKGE